MRNSSFLVLLVHVLTSAAGTAHGTPKRNVLLLISDNQNYTDSGCYGNPVVKTPHIDRLAEEGVRFEYALATTASCGPSRGVIYTGLHSHSNGQYGHAHGYHNFRLLPNVRTVFELLQADGYRTSLIGKAHIHPPDGAIEFQPKISSRDVTGMAQAAAEFIMKAGKDPFFLVIGYSDPHPTSREGPGWGIRRQYHGLDPVVYDPGDVIVPAYLPDRPEVREGLAGYYQQISRLDTGIGQVLDVLRAAGKEDQTLVIFTSDHGSSEPGAMANHYEPGVRIPLVVRKPGGKKRGIVNHAMVTLADLVPTILDWTQTSGPDYRLHGRSILPVLDEPNPEGWDEVYLSHVFHEVTMYYPMRTIRTRRYKMIWNITWRQEYPLPIDTLARATWQETLRRGDRFIGTRRVHKFLYRDEIELYNLEDDPNEILNLADDPQYSATRRELSEKLLAFLRRTDDPWLLRHSLPQPEESAANNPDQSVERP